MHLDAELMRQMSDSHLIASLRATQDSLTDTPVELELLRRLEEYEAVTKFVRDTANRIEELNISNID